MNPFERFFQLPLNRSFAMETRLGGNLRGA
jgi:hypothetical protein